MYGAQPMVIIFGYGGICLQQHNAFIKPTNTFIFKSWFAPKFDIQGVHKIMNLVGESRTMWLADVRTQLVFNLE